jgi:hypothetical protein
VKNESNRKWILEEGNAGNFQLLAELEPTKEYEIIANPNAAFREYCLATDPAALRLLINTTDCLKFESFIIQEDGTLKREVRSATDGPRTIM